MPTARRARLALLAVLTPACAGAGRGGAPRAWRHAASLARLGMVLRAGTSGNDVAVGDDGSVVVSNYASSVGSIVDNVKIGLGWVTGDVLLWRQGVGWSHVPGTAASAANGVALSPDGRTLY